MRNCSFEEAKDVIYSINLDKIIERLMKNYKWSLSEAQEASKQYRNYLFLKLKYPEQDLPPSQDIDEVWHMHILFSKDYINVCQKVFGGYLHHNPHEEISKDLEEKFNSQTQELYKKEFGDYIYSVRESASKKLTWWLKSIINSKCSKRIIKSSNINHQLTK